MNKTQSKLSPFEFKDILLSKAAELKEQYPTKNAGRGNPDFLATVPRHAFIELGQFALTESERSYCSIDNLLGGIPTQEGIVTRWESFVMCHPNPDSIGMRFLISAISYIKANLSINESELLYEWVMSYLGCNYPVPPRILVTIEKITALFLKKEMACEEHSFDVFATEDGTAAMTYLFQSISNNGLLKRGEKIAIVTPIFTPYLEIPHLPMFEHEIVYIETSEKDNWQLTQSEINKLKNKEIRLLCVVNPSNHSSLNMIKDIVDNYNNDLMIITDDVYSSFSDNFKSLFAICPYNTLLVYSFSKYFGATGWRIGNIAVHHNNIFDKLLTELSETQKQELDRHYHGLTQNIRELKFIDRLVADSRAVALNHTAGLSLPQQLMMSLFCLNELLDFAEHYKQHAKRLVRHRYDTLYSAIGLPNYFETLPNNVGYYTTIDIKKLATQLINAEFAATLEDRFDTEQFLLKLAENTGVVLMSSNGFGDTNNLVVRISLANLTDSDYQNIGQLIKKEIFRLANHTH